MLSATDRLEEGHHGLVTGLSVHPHMSQSKRSRRVFLSSGVDWSTKLWSFNLPSSTAAEPLQDTASGQKSSGTGNGKMLCDFRGVYEQVSAVEWSPTHPSLFATGNGVGQVSVWDLTHSLEDPRLPPTTVSNTCLTKLRWSTDGRRIAVGDLDGKVSLISVSPDVADANIDSMANFEKVLNKLQ